MSLLFKFSLKKTEENNKQNLKAITGSRHKGSYISYLVPSYQLCTNCFYITTSANHEQDVFANDRKGRGSSRSLGSISLKPSSWCSFRGSVLKSSNPPVSLLFGRLASVASCWIITIGGLVVKHCTGLIPGKKTILEVKIASL